MKLLVTAGPTREHIDDVRFLSNPSSGKIGFEVAAAGVRAGHDVTLVTGPVSLQDVPGAETVRVLSAREMAQACLSRFAECEAVVMTAAVCDYAPKERHAGKLKKSGKNLHIELCPTTDILEEMGRRKKEQLLVGFALEAENARENAKNKLRRKNLDFIVLNSPSTFAEDTIACEIIDRQGTGVRFERAAKKSLAEEIIRIVEKACSGTS